LSDDRQGVLIVLVAIRAREKPLFLGKYAAPQLVVTSDLPGFVRELGHDLVAQAGPHGAAPRVLHVKHGQPPWL
jgi:hypothetical protein